MAKEQIMEPAAEAAAKLEKKIAAKVAQLKKLHKNVYVLQVTESAGIPATEDTPYTPPVVRVAYLKPVTRQALAMATALADRDPYKYNAIILRECWLDGDMEIQEDDSLFLNAMRQLDQLVEFKEAEIKKY